MSNVHVASAANEVAQALPSTATVTVSKHGIQAIETLNLDAQSASDKSITWSRTFSGMEILTNPILQYRIETKFAASRTASARPGRIFADVEVLDMVKKHLRLRSDPIANAASSINVTINNASMAMQPARDHRLVNTTYPDEAVVGNQRQHYGLNQLDRWAEPREREFAIVTEDDVETQFNNNSLRQNYPSRLYAAEDTQSTTAQPVNPDDYYLIDDVAVYTLIVVAGVPAAGTYYVRSTVIETGTGDDPYIGKIIIDAATTTNSSILQHYTLLDSTNNPIRLDNVMMSGNLFLTLPGSDEIPPLGKDGADIGALEIYPRIVTARNMYVQEFTGSINVYSKAKPFAFEHFKIVHDVSQPLAHPYFRDNIMRDNTLVNARYFDCQITISDVNKLVEAVNPGTLWGQDAGFSGKFSYLGENTTYTTSLLLSTSNGFVQTTPELAGVSTAAVVRKAANTLGMTPRLIFDLVTPSVPLPTISDKVVSTFHTMTSSSVSSLPARDLKSGNIQLSQIPDKIYVFCKSSLMESKVTTLQTQPSTRLGVCTKLRIRTPQNSAFLIEMDQESLYQMSVRNGSKQSRSSFMCTLGSVVCIDPEKDLGGYTNGVLLPYTFDVQADFAQPCASGTDSILWRSDIDSKRNARQPISTTDETWTLFVVCELHGHLYLMSDGTGKQTKSNLTVTEVADAVAEGLQHPSTLGNQARSQKMDAGVLAEVARAGETRDALRG